MGTAVGATDFSGTDGAPGFTTGVAFRGMPEAACPNSQVSLVASAPLHSPAIGRPRHRATGTTLSAGDTPNALWCADFKGEFKLGNGQYCYPLTVTDHASRFLLLCEALESTREDPAITAFEQLFLQRGLPQAIRSDNGVPFASANALFNLSKLSVWWLRLGIAIERIWDTRSKTAATSACI